MSQTFEFERVLKFYDSNESSLREDDRSTITTQIDDADQALTLLLRPILRAFQSLQLPISILSVKAAGPFSHAQWLTELVLDFQSAKVEFRIKTLNIPFSLAMIYRKIESSCQLKFLHLRYVSLNQEDEQVLKEIIDEQRLVVLFLGVVSMEGRLMMEALQNSTTLQTVAVIWLHLEPAGHNFPVVEFCRRLHEFKSIHNIVLLPFATDPFLWVALNAGLRQSTTLQDVMISGEGGCVLHDDIVSGIIASISRTSMKRLRLNKATIGKRAMSSLCELLQNSCIEFLDLSASSLSLETVTIFADVLPRMTNLRVIDLRETRDENQNSWTREILETLLTGLCQNETLEDVILSYTPETLDLKARRDFYLQRNRSRPMMVENVLAVWPEVLARVGLREQTSLMYHLLRERVDVLYAANSPRLKRAPPDSGEDGNIRTKKQKAIEHKQHPTHAHTTVSSDEKGLRYVQRDGQQHKK
jgi:hypothetical protein